MKRFFSAVFLIFSTVFALAGCTETGESSKEKSSISVYNWGDYIDETLLADFEAKTGIHVNYETFSSNEDMYVKIKAAGSSYDILIPSDYMIERLIKEDLIQKIDFNNIPNIKNIHERFKNLDYDPTGEYSVPYMWGTVGILYNKTMVAEPVDSWNILWDEKYSKQIFMYNSQRDSIGVTLKKLGFPINTTDPGQLAAAKDELIKQKPLVQAYVGDNVKDKMIGNEGALALSYSGDAVYVAEQNPEIGYAVPKEGSNVWFDSIVIPKSSKNKSGAEAFIDFLCEPDAALKNTEYIGYSTTNKAAFEMLSEELRENPAYWPSDDVFNNCEVFLDLGERAKDYDIVWTEVQVAK